jgi:Zn-dependent protease with chaperone function
MHMKRIFSLILAALCAAHGPASGESRLPTDVLTAIRDADLRLATLGRRLALANAALCTRQQPDTGLVFLALDAFDVSFRKVLQARFDIDSNVAVEAVVPNSPASSADLREGDSLISVNGLALKPGIEGPPTMASIVAVHERFATLAADKPIRFEIRRRGVPHQITIMPTPACRSRFELRVGSAFDASSDGEMVQIGSRFLAALGDDDLAVLVAHELAHNILEHPQRLAAVGADGGLLAGFGRNVAFFRQTETQADILSVSLIANAGFAPENAPKFWRGAGRRIYGSAFADRSHPSWRDRAATTEAEANKIAQTAARPYVSDVLKSRGVPLDGNWQAILVRARR